MSIPDPAPISAGDADAAPAVHARPFWRRWSSWWAWLCLAGAIGLAGWTVYLRVTLPRTYLVTMWDATWVGFDIMLASAFLATAIAALGRWRWFVIMATFTGTMLFMDAWFDVMEASEPADQSDSWLSAVLEIPLGIIFLSVASFRLHTLTRRAEEPAPPITADAPAASGGTSAPGAPAAPGAPGVD